MKDLISKSDFISATELKKYRMQRAATPLMKLMGIHKMNTMYHELYQYNGLEFIEEFFKKMEVDFIYDASEFQNIPTSGPFITVSNHPFGAMDGLILMKMIGYSRPDYKLMGNFLLEHVDPLKDRIISVNPLAHYKHLASSLAGMRNALKHIQEGNSMGIFPAGQVSSFSPKTKVVTDSPWQLPAIKLIQRAKVPIIPVYFQGSNSAMFNILGLIHPSLRTATLPKELMNKNNTTFRVRIGQAIRVKEQKDIQDPEQFARYLRAKTYALGSTLKVKKFYLPRIKFGNKTKTIDPRIPTHLLQEELNQLKSKGKCLHTQQNFEVYIAKATEIPHTLAELAILREITFREVGEGTGQANDRDEYDLYYHHLFVWDTEAKSIVGAYRMGKASDILPQYGVQGFYTHSLFSLKKGILPVLEHSVELGRSFILKRYQRHRLSLFMLWKGIAVFLRNNPDCRYLLGPVSISNEYSKHSRALLVKFIKAHYYDKELAKFAQPRHPFKVKAKKVQVRLDMQTLLEEIGPDLKKVDKLISDIEPSHMKLPVLLKKYISQNARVIGFNVDPKFNNCLDGLIILDTRDLPEATMQNYETRTKG